MGLAPPAMPGGIMKFADFFGEIEIDDEELINDDHQGHLVAEAHRIVSGDSVDPPTVEHLAALISELGWTRELIRELETRTVEDIPF